jgi:hypothetical protein
MTDYLYTSGGFPSSPSSGDSLVINGLFYDWTGTAWKVRSTVSNRVEFTATANQATKTGLTYFVGSIDCYINGSKMLLGTDFTATDGTSVTFTPALDLDDEVQLIMGVSASSAAGGGAASNTSTLDLVLASNIAAKKAAIINSDGKIDGISQVVGASGTLLTGTQYSNTSGYSASGSNYRAAVDPFNSNRFALVGSDSTPNICVGLVAADDSVTFGAAATGQSSTGGTGHHDIVWDPVNENILWVRSGASSSSIHRFSVSGTTLTALGRVGGTQTNSEWGTLDVHPTISNRFIITKRSARTIEYCRLDTNTTYTVLSSTSIGAKSSHTHIAKFFPDDGSKILMLYARSSGGTHSKIATINADNSLSLTSNAIGDNQLGTLSDSANFKGKGFAWEPNGDSSTGYRFALMVNGLTGASPTTSADLIVGTVTNVGAGTITLGTPVDWGGVSIEGGTALTSLLDSEFTSNLAFSPHNKTDLWVGTNYFGKVTLSGNEITLPTAFNDLVSHTLSSGSWDLIINLGSSGKFLSLMRGTTKAIVNYHERATVSTLDATKIIGIVNTAGVTDDTRPVQYAGTATGFSGLTTGSTHYVQGDGSITAENVGVSATTVASVPIGIAIDPTTLLIKFNNHGT